MAELRVEAAFREIIGEPLASTCETVGLRGSVLTVVTTNPALAHQLRLDSGVLLERLNERRLGRTLKSLQVRTGRGRVAGGGA